MYIYIYHIYHTIYHQIIVSTQMKKMNINIQDINIYIPVILIIYICISGLN